MLGSLPGTILVDSRGASGGMPGLILRIFPSEQGMSWESDQKPDKLGVPDIPSFDPSLLRWGEDWASCLSCPMLPALSTLLSPLVWSDRRNRAWSRVWLSGPWIFPLYRGSVASSIPPVLLPAAVDPAEIAPFHPG